MRIINAIVLALFSAGVLAHHDEPTRVISTVIDERLRVIELINVTAEKEQLSASAESSAVAALLDEVDELDEIQGEEATAEK